MLAATHHELKMPDDVEKFVNEVQGKTPEAVWKQLASTKRKTEAAWYAQIGDVRDPEQLQQELDSLSERFAYQKKNSFLENYALVLAHPRPIAYLTSMFLLTGWFNFI